MADYQDNLGRNVPTNGMNPDEIKGMLASLMKNKVNTKPVGPEKSDKSYEKLLGLLSNFKDFEAEMGEVKKILAQMNNKSNKKSRLSNAETKYYKSMDKFTAHGLKKGSIYVHDVYAEKLLKKIAIQLGAKVGGKKSGGGGGGGGGGHNIPKIMSEEAKWEFTERESNIASHASRYIQKVADTVLGGINIDEALFGGMIQQEQKFRQEIKAVAYETDAVTAATGSLQKEYLDIDYTTKRTGVNMTKFQNAYVKNLGIGLKSHKESKKLTENQLYAERQLGLEAGSLEKTYQSMAVELRMGSNQIMAISKGMQSVARSTGLTGQQMQEVVASSEQFMRNMSNSGKVTTESVKNLMRATAEAKKLGVGGKQDELNKGFTNSADLFGGKMNSDMQAFMFRAASTFEGGMAALQSQTITESKETYSKFVKGMEADASKILGLKDLTKETVDNLTGMQKFQANLKAQALGFEGVGELQKFVEANKKASQTFAQNLADITKEEQNAMTVSQKLAAQKRKENLMGEESMDIINAVLESKGKELSADKKKQFITGMAAGGVKVGSSQTDVVSAALNKQIEVLNKNRQEAGLSTLKLDKHISAAVNNPKALAELTEQINNGQKEVDTALKDNLDPVTKTNRLLEEGNAILREMSSGFLRMFADIFGTLGMLAVAASSLVSSGLLSSLSGLKSLKNFSNLIGGGGGKAAGAAAAVNPFASMSGSMGKAASATPGFAGSAAGAGGGTFAKLITGAQTKLTGLASGFGNAIGTVGKVLSKAALPITIVVGGLMAIKGGMDAVANAGAIFNKSLKDVTENEKSAAYTAGSFTGVLNFLTFGIFDKALGPTGSLTIALSKFFAIFKPAMFVVTIFRKLFETVWNIIKGIALGIWEVLKGIWEGIEAIFEPIGEVFDEIWEAIKAIMYPFELLGEMFGFVGGETSFIVEAFKGLGKAIGWLFKIVGKIIGFILKVVVAPLKGIAQIITGIFSFDLKKIGEGLLNVFFALPKVLWDTFKNAITGIGKFLLDTFLGVLKFVFIELPKMIWNGLVAGFDFLVVELPTMIWNGLVAGFDFLVVELPTMIWDGLVAGFDFVVVELPTMLWNAVTEALGGLVDWVLSFIPGAEGFAGDAAENDARREEEGYSFFNGIGATLGGIMDLDVEKTFDGIGETIAAPFAAVGGWLSSLNPFAEGTTKVKNDGAAFLHAGEAVIPAPIAQGSGAFKDSDFMGMLSNPLESMMGMLTSPIDGMMGMLGLGGSPAGGGNPINDIISKFFGGDQEQGMEQNKIQGTSLSPNSELSIISEANLMQVELMRTMISVLEEIRDEVSDSGTIKNRTGEQGAASDTNIVPGKPARFYKSSIGKYDQGSAAQVTNN